MRCAGSARRHSRVRRRRFFPIDLSASRFEPPRCAKSAFPTPEYDAQSDVNTLSRQPSRQGMERVLFLLIPRFQKSPFRLTAMRRIGFLTLTVFLAALMPACNGSGDAGPPATVSAIELHTAFMADAKASQKRWSGKTLFVTGEVAIATERMSGWTMSGKVEVPAKVYLRTEVDYLQHDIKYVVCDSDFDLPQPGGGFRLDPRIAVGKPLTVECAPAKLRWSSPGLYLSHCRVADP
jgi:hypothetical protein